MSEPLTTGAVIGVLVILIGKSVYSISKRVKKSKCTNGGVEMDFSGNPDCPEQSRQSQRQHRRHRKRKHRRDPANFKNKAKEKETKLKKL